MRPTLGGSRGGFSSNRELSQATTKTRVVGMNGSTFQPGKSREPPKQSCPESTRYCKSTLQSFQELWTPRLGQSFTQVQQKPPSRSPFPWMEFKAAGVSSL